MAKEILFQNLNTGSLEECISQSVIDGDTIIKKNNTNYKGVLEKKEEILKISDDSVLNYSKIGTSFIDSLNDKNELKVLKNRTPEYLNNGKQKIFFSSDSSFNVRKERLIKNSKKIINDQLGSLKPKGNVSLGYEYGVLPFVAGNNYLSGGYKTEGRISFLLLKLPLELSFSYTDIKNTTGLRNYFRLSYDANRYKDQVAEKLNLKDKLSHEKLEKLELEQQTLMQKIEYLNFSKQNPNYISSINGSLKNKYTSNTILEDPKDSLSSIDTSGLYSINKKNNLSPYSASSFGSDKSDSVKNYYFISQKNDSIIREINAYKSKYDSINNEIIVVKKEIDQIKRIENNPTAINPYLSNVQRYLSYIKKIEIGLCTPSYSTFLVNNIPLQGINVELSKNNNFFAFTYGTTINNLLSNSNTLQGKIQGIRNTYNYFDFGNLTAGRKIISLKGGVGAKDDTHLYVGILLGKGRTDYLLPANDPYATTKESNVVMELDCKYKFSKQLNLDVVLGKSSVKDEDLTTEQVKKSINEIFSGFRSYALLAKLNFDIKRTNTKLTFSTRWIDPYFKSFGIGFLRSDNLRFEIKAEQQITKKIRYTIAFKREEDNILRLYNYKNTLQSINNSLNIKINRQFNVRLNYNPLFRELKSNDFIEKDLNYISTVVLSYTPRSEKITTQFNALYSKYSISGDSSNINFENFTYTHQLQFKSGFKTGLNVSFFKNSLKDTLNNDTYLGVLDVGYVSKSSNSFSIGGKMAYKNGLEIQYGFIAKATLKVYKNLFWEASAEKILIGDYYDSLLTDQIKRFPYYCNTKLVLNF